MCVQSQYSQFRHLCSGILLNHNPEDTMVLSLTAYSLYFDVAGHPSDRPSICCGGFLATEKGWLEFEPAWNAALAKNGLPPVFHMTDFESKYKNHPDHWDILKSLIDVIDKHLLASFSNNLNMDGYRQVNARYPLEEMFGKPYGISATCAARLAFHWKNYTRRTGPLLIFVEKGTYHEGDMLECFKRDGHDAPIPVSKELAASQAADLYAWERAYYNNTGLRRPSLAYLKSKMPDRLRALDGKWDKRDMMQALRKIDVPPRKELPENPKIVFGSAPKKNRKRTI